MTVNAPESGGVCDGCGEFIDGLAHRIGDDRFHRDDCPGSVDGVACVLSHGPEWRPASDTQAYVIVGTGDAARVWPLNLEDELAQWIVLVPGQTATASPGCSLMVLEGDGQAWVTGMVRD